MPRKKLTRQEKLIAMMRADGDEIPESLLLNLNQRDERRHEADSLIEFLDNRHLFDTRLCKQCQRPFATNYGSVAVCSDMCRQTWLRNIGIEWNSAKPQGERWGQIPLVVPPDALVLAKTL
jgi:hypothetical protein